MLPAEIWVLILSYLNHVDLLNISTSKELFYYFSHKNERFIHRLNHSKFIVCNTDIFDKHKDAWCCFVHQLSYKLKKCCDDDTVLIIRKKYCLILFLKHFLFVFTIICLIVTEVFMSTINAFSVLDFMSEKELYMTF